MSPTAYAWLRTFHIFGVMLWVGTMMSLLHILDAHARAELSARAAFHRLERAGGILMDVGCTLSLVFGVLLILNTPGVMKQGYMHAKMTLVVVVFLAMHGYLRVKIRKFRATVVKPLPAILTPLVTLAILAVVALVVVQPF